MDCRRCRRKIGRYCEIDNNGTAIMGGASFVACPTVDGR